MKPLGLAAVRNAFCRLELMVVLAVLALLAALAVPVLAGTRSQSNRVECLNNLRRVGLAFHTWAAGHKNLFPGELVDQGNPWLYDAMGCFLIASNELGTPAFLTCPADRGKTRASSFFRFGFGDALSYFTTRNGSAIRPETWVSGDRNFFGTILRSKVTITQQSGLAWDNTLHIQSGNLLLADGSAWAVSNAELSNYVKRAVAQDPAGQILLNTP
jgi:type II secretory pathway pseudopilin PulG